MKSDKEGNTRIDEIANGIYRISTPVPPKVMPGGFTFNQYLIVDDAPLLYHTGPRKMFPLVRDAIASVIASAPTGWAVGRVGNQAHERSDKGVTFRSL